MISNISAWGDTIVMGGGILLFAFIWLYVYRRSARAEQAKEAMLPFAGEDEFDG